MTRDREPGTLAGIQIGDPKVEVEQARRRDDEPPAGHPVESRDATLHAAQFVHLATSQRRVDGLLIVVVRLANEGEATAVRGEARQNLIACELGDVERGARQRGEFEKLNPRLLARLRVCRVGKRSAIGRPGEPSTSERVAIRSRASPPSAGTTRIRGASSSVKP